MRDDEIDAFEYYLARQAILYKKILGMNLFDGYIDVTKPWGPGEIISSNTTNEFSPIDPNVYKKWKEDTIDFNKKIKFSDVEKVLKSTIQLTTKGLK